VLTEAGVNFSDIEVLTEAGVNWSDVGILSEAGMNYDRSQLGRCYSPF